MATPILDPGDALRIELFFTGYGEINQAKLFFFPSDAVFDIQKSWVESGFHKTADGFAWGGSRELFLNSEMAMLVSFQGLQLQGWTEKTSFLDADAHVNVIATEMKYCGKAPLELSLQTAKNIKPGKYYIEFCFTYYDGQKWRSNTRRAEFTVRTFIERHQQKVAIWGIVASVSGLSLGVARFFSSKTSPPVSVAAPNPSIERTASGGLRPPPAAAQLER
jgi:hypothetical protein